LPDAVTAELDYICYFGVSNRTGEETQYECWLYSVEPNQTLDLLSAPSWNNNPPMFLTFEELSSRTDLTWSTPAIAREFLENQEAVLAVITRAGQRETEFLLIDNANYGGYFFPTQRVKTEVKPDQVAKGTVRADLGYRGLALPAYLGEIADVHFSNRFFRDRNYRFHICEVQLPDVDLHQPGNILERAMTRRGKTIPLATREPAERPGGRVLPDHTRHRALCAEGRPHAHFRQTFAPFGRRDRVDSAHSWRKKAMARPVERELEGILFHRRPPRG
jgi:hypothetical protein